ncbi:putative protein similar to vertebrate basic leucine zipper and W2 domains 2 (BZW2) (zgc:55580) [Scleropages formosus]|uniref:5MP1/2-like HEAT domain-containing protein n=1 Tax=Scleropages formosus TaxID=113540 RepID=A0A0P7XYZ0_SCLFO|nr:putative protein similar to vertebrate basic leucine zipper and W2 domains 2 (BZW2) (zgc:55580) [Scleropages formosus]
MIDEKEKFEPTVFRDTIVQGLNEAGGDLDAVAKFLDATGSRLDYRRYADVLFDILIAGSMLAPGGTRIDDADKSKVTTQCVFRAPEEHAAIRTYAQVFNKLIRRYKYLEKAFEEEVKKLLLFLKAFSEGEQTKLAMLTGILLANGTLPPSIITSLFSDNLVKEGISASFSVKMFKAWIAEKDGNAVTSALRKSNLDKKLLVLAWLSSRPSHVRRSGKLCRLRCGCVVSAQSLHGAGITRSQRAQGASLGLQTPREHFHVMGTRGAELLGAFPQRRVTGGSLTFTAVHIWPPGEQWHMEELSAVERQQEGKKCL